MPKGGQVVAAADTVDKINCSFKLSDFWVPAMVSIACGGMAVSLGLYFLIEDVGGLQSGMYAAVDLACSVPFFMIAVGYIHLLAGEYTMEITAEHIVWPLPNMETLHPLTRKHVTVPMGEVASISIIGDPSGGSGLVLLVRRNGQRFLVGLPSLAMAPDKLGDMFQRHGYRTTVKITG